MTDQPNPLTQLTELHSLHPEWVKAGLEPWWPEEIRVAIDSGVTVVALGLDDKAWVFHLSTQLSTPSPWLQHALTLVVAAGERVLEQCGVTRTTDMLGRLAGYLLVSEQYGVKGHYTTLPEALRAVMEAKV
jgi:hypothetical protein